jgi:hypothetical protein
MYSNGTSGGRFGGRLSGDVEQSISALIEMEKVDQVPTVHLDCPRT